MAVVANRAIFGGGIYSTKGARMMKIIGNAERQVSEISIAKTRGGQRVKRGGIGVFRPGMVKPYMPKRISDPYHPGGNSLCYMIQTAHLMGASRIYALAFTLQSGSPYEFGRTNPVTGRASLYDEERSLAWLAWYEKTYPGKVRLLPGWSGPIYHVFTTEDLHEVQSRHQPDQEAGVADPG